MQSVVSATEDLLLFILSEKGQRVRVFLLQDIIRVVDIFLEEQVLDLNMKKKQTINPRVSNHRKPSLFSVFFSSRESEKTVIFEISSLFFNCFRKKGQ